MSEIPYTIIAGIADRPLTTKAGFLEKNRGRADIAEEKGEYVVKPANISFPNKTEAWGRRVIKDKSGKIINNTDTVINVKDEKYRGDIEFLHWGDSNGILITCRYLKGYSSLDVMYQNLILNAEENIDKDGESALDYYWIMYTSGENEFDDKTDPLLIQHLKIHEYNLNSKSKNPNKHSYLFSEKIYEQVAETLDKIIDAKQECFSIISIAATDNTFKKLKNLFELIRPIANDYTPKENELLSTLKRLADTNAEGFLNCVNTYRRNLSDAFEKAKSYNAIDLTKNGQISAGVDKMVIIANNIPEKGENMIDWCSLEYLDPISYEAMFQLKKITDNLN